jgi:hypothetical protein
MHTQYESKVDYYERIVGLSIPDATFVDYFSFDLWKPTN